jgi:hypothetical protein
MPNNTNHRPSLAHLPASAASELRQPSLHFAHSLLCHCRQFGSHSLLAGRACRATPSLDRNRPPRQGVPRPAPLFPGSDRVQLDSDSPTERQRRRTRARQGMAGAPAVEQPNGPHNSTSTSRNNGLLLPSALPRPTTATSSVASPRPSSGVSAAPTNHDRSVDGQLDGQAVRKSHSQSVSSNPHTLASSKGSLSPDNRDRQRAVRTLPRKTHVYGSGD